MNLEALIDRAFREGGLEEITIRVSRYAADGRTPEAFQAIAKYRGRTAGPWGVGVMASASAATRHSLAPAVSEGSVFD